MSRADLKMSVPVVYVCDGGKQGRQHVPVLGARLRGVLTQRLPLVFEEVDGGLLLLGDLQWCNRTYLNSAVCTGGPGRRLRLRFAVGVSGTEQNNRVALTLGS